MTSNGHKPKHQANAYERQLACEKAEREAEQRKRREEAA